MTIWILSFTILFYGQSSVVRTYNIEYQEYSDCMKDAKKYRRNIMAGNEDVIARVIPECDPMDKPLWRETYRAYW